MLINNQLILIGSPALALTTGRGFLPHSGGVWSMWAVCWFVGATTSSVILACSARAGTLWVKVRAIVATAAIVVRLIVLAPFLRSVPWAMVMAGGPRPGSTHRSRYDRYPLSSGTRRGSIQW